MSEENKSYYDVMITGDGDRLVRDKIVTYYNRTIAGEQKTVVHFSDGNRSYYDPKDLTVEQLDHFMTSTPQYIYDARK